MPRRKGPPCSRESFGSQSAYEDCLDQHRREQNRDRNQSSRLTDAFSEYAALHDAADSDVEIDED